MQLIQLCAPQLCPIYLHHAYQSIPITRSRETFCYLFTTLLRTQFTHSLHIYECTSVLINNVHCFILGFLPKYKTHLMLELLRHLRKFTALQKAKRARYEERIVNSFSQLKRLVCFKVAALLADHPDLMPNQVNAPAV